MLPIFWQGPNAPPPPPSVLFLFLDRQFNSIFNDIETFLHILSCAAVSMIMDSSGRVLDLGQDRMEAECQVALNGPPLAQSANIIKAAHTLYWCNSKRK